MLNRFIGGATVGCILSALAGVSIYALGLTTFPGWLVIMFVGVIAGIAAAVSGLGEVA
jgi:hypothetical protein